MNLEHKVAPRNLIVQIDVPYSKYKDAEKAKGKHLLYDYTLSRNGYCTKALDRISKSSIKSFQAYAERCGAEYILFDEPIYNWVSPSFERMRLIVEDYWAQTYDNILYVDADVLCNPQAPNIFKKYPKPCLRAVKRWKPLRMGSDTMRQMQHESASPEMRIFCERGVSPATFRERYFNAGVVLFDSNSLIQLKKHQKFKRRCFEWKHCCQGEINFCAAKYNLPFQSIDPRFNKSIPSTSTYRAHINRIPLERLLSKKGWFFHFIGNKNVHTSVKDGDSARAKLLNFFESSELLNT